MRKTSKNYDRNGLFRDFRDSSRELFALASAVLILFASGLFQLFPLPGWVDAGMYLGYFLDLPLLVEKFGIDVTSYHATRIPYVLPGYFFHHRFNPAIGHILFVALQFLACIAAAWLIGFRFGGRQIAFLTAALIVFNPLVLSATSFGGVDGTAVAFTLWLGVCLFYRPAPLTHALQIALGVLLVLAASSQPFTAPVCGAMIIAKLLIDRHSLQQIFRLFLVASGAALLTVAALGTLSSLLGMKFFYFFDSMPMAKLALNGIGVNYREPFEDWFFGAYRILPAVCLQLVGVYYICRPDERNQKEIVAVVLALFIGNGAFLLIDLLVGASTLQSRFYTNLLIPLNVLATAVLVGSSSVPDKPFRLLFLSAVCFLPALIAVLLIKANWSWWASKDERLFVFISICLLFLLSLIVRRFKAVHLANLILVLGVISAGAFNVDSLKIYRHYVGLKFLHVFKISLDFNILASQYLRSGNRVLIAYSRDKHTVGNAEKDKRLRYSMRFGPDLIGFSVYDTMSSLYMYDRSILTALAPTVDTESMNRLMPKDRGNVRLLVLGQRDAEVIGLLDELQSTHKVRFQVQSEKMLSSGKVWFKVWTCVSLE